MVLVRRDATDGLQEEILFCSPLETTPIAADGLGIDIFLKNHDLKWRYLFSGCTDGTPVMLVARSGFSKLVR